MTELPPFARNKTLRAVLPVALRQSLNLAPVKLSEPEGRQRAANRLPVLGGGHGGGLKRIGSRGPCANPLPKGWGARAMWSKRGDSFLWREGCPRRRLAMARQAVARRSSRMPLVVAGACVCGRWITAPGP